MQFLSVSEAAREFGVRPREISDLFYQRVLSDDQCPIVGGRRLIPLDYLPEVASAPRKRGRPAKAETATEGG